jgi:hypothetical protein
MPIVEVEGQRFEFPDGTPDEVIGQSIRTFFGEPTTPAEATPVAQPTQTAQQRLPDVQPTDIGGVAPDITSATQQQIDPNILAQAQAAGFQPPVADDGTSVLSVVEPAVTLATGAIAEPIAGLAGIAQAVNPFAEPGAGARAVEATREFITVKPQSEEGQRGLEAVGEVLQPVADVLQTSEKFLGDETFKATSSPVLAAAATTIPTLLLELIGVAGAKGSLKTAENLKAASNSRQVKKAVVSAAPDIEQIKDISRGVYKELDDSGVSLQPKAFKGMVNRINQAVRKSGFDEDLTPKTASVLRRLESELGTAPTLTQVDTLRKVAQNAAKSLEPADAALGSIIVDNIDSFLDIVSPTAFKKGTLTAAEITPKFKVARELWGRARRSELINESFEKAKNQASGFENGLVTQFRSILNNKKKSRFFKKGEIEAMQQVVRGTTTGNIAKVIGRLGFTEGHATNILGGLAGSAAGAAVGGPIGAVAVPVIGQVSRKLAQKLTRKNAEFADTVIRAGSNAEGIARAYIDATPKKLRTSAELSELLSRPDIALDNLVVAKNPLLREAAEIAQGNKILAAVTTAPGAIESATQQTTQEQQ